MKCVKCGSENIKVQAVSIVKNKHHGIWYWLFIGWWFETIMWVFLTLPWFFIKIFKPKKIKTKVKSYATCQECGHTWTI